MRWRPPRKEPNVALFPAAQVIEFLHKRLGYDGEKVKDAARQWGLKNRGRKRQITQITMAEEIEEILKGWEKRGRKMKKAR